MKKSAIFALGTVSAWEPVEFPNFVIDLSIPPEERWVETSMLFAD